MYDCLHEIDSRDVWQSLQNLDQERTIRAHTSHGRITVNESRARRVKDSFLSDSSPFVNEQQKKFEAGTNRKNFKPSMKELEKYEEVPHTSFFRKRSNIFGEEDQRLQVERERQNFSHDPHASDRRRTDVNLLKHYPYITTARNHFNTASPMYSQVMCAKPHSDLPMNPEALQRPSPGGQWQTGRVKTLGATYFDAAFRNA